MFTNNQSEVHWKCGKGYINIRHSTASYRIHSPTPFTVLDALIDCEFPLTYKLCFLWWLLHPFLKVYMTAIRHFIAAWQAPCKPVLTSQLYHRKCIWLHHITISCCVVNRQWCNTYRGLVNLHPLLFATLLYVAHILYCYPIKCMRLIAQLYSSTNGYLVFINLLYSYF